MTNDIIRIHELLRRKKPVGMLCTIVRQLDTLIAIYSYKITCHIFASFTALHNEIISL